MENRNVGYKNKRDLATSLVNKDKTKRGVE